MEDTTAVTFLVPRASGEGGISSYDERFHVSTRAATPSRHSRRGTDVNILVADDDRDFSLMLCTILEEGGHTTIPAYDSIQAFMYAIRQDTNMVLLDINMPGGTGIEVMRKLRQSKKTASIPVVVLTGSADPEIKKKAMELGAAAFLRKPVDPDVLLMCVNRVLTT